MLLTLLVDQSLAPCHSTQPSLPPDGRWTFLLNFNLAQPLRGCLIDRTTPGQTIYTVVACTVADPQRVTFDAEGVRRFARFDGTGTGVICPNFDPPGSGAAQREYKNLIAVVRPAASNASHGNPLLFHPANTNATAPADLKYSMPIVKAGNFVSVGFATQLGSLGVFTSPMGATLGNWNVLSSEMTRKVPYVLTHTINAGNVLTFSPTPLLFNFNPVTLSIGLDPVKGESFFGDIDEIILDPRTSIGGD